MTGRLIIAGNSLGKTDDIPARSLVALRESDLLIFEEPRIARQSLKAAGIHRDFLKLSEHAESQTIDDARSALGAGKTVCYMSDQGMPNMADPGARLTELAYEIGASIQVIPGPSAITAAIAACPFDCDRFRFVGFLPRAQDQRIARLKELAHVNEVQIIFDTPYRIKHLLSDCASVFPKQHLGLLSIDISGENEAHHVANFRDLARIANSLSEKLNFVLVIDAFAS